MTKKDPHVEWMVNGDGKRTKVRFILLTRSAVESWGTHARIHRFYQELVKAGFDMEREISTKYSRVKQEYRYWQGCGDGVQVADVAPGKKLRRLVSLERD